VYAWRLGCRTARAKIKAVKAGWRPAPAASLSLAACWPNEAAAGGALPARVAWVQHDLLLRYLYHPAAGTP
jgi:hypothetical protein